jgi:hypothetical protein
MIDINPFQSFWMAGFECTDKLNAFGNRVDFLKLTAHLDMIEEDYAGLSRFNIKTVREGIRWSQVEKRPYEYDWTDVEHMILAAKKSGIQQVWDLCHFGFPDDLTPLHPMFARRFAALCRAFIHFYRQVDPYGTIILTPINEVSFLSWLGGDARGTSPYCINMGWEVKYYLMRAYIEGVAAIKDIDPTVRVLTTEPLVNIVPQQQVSPQQIADAALMHEQQYQALDMLCGNMCPELGGKPEYLDILGFNYYHNNQWIAGTGQLLPWANEAPDLRWRNFSSLVKEAYARYNRPVVLTETSHAKEHRPNWITKIARETTLLLQEGIPFWGICLYPIIDRPDWDFTDVWHQSGLWDAEIIDGLPTRVLYQPYAEAILQAQALIHPPLFNEADSFRMAV